MVILERVLNDLALGCKPMGMKCGFLIGKEAMLIEFQRQLVGNGRSCLTALSETVEALGRPIKWL